MCQPSFKPGYSELKLAFCRFLIYSLSEDEKVIGFCCYFVYENDCFLYIICILLHALHFLDWSSDLRLSISEQLRFKYVCVTSMIVLKLLCSS